MSNTKDYLFEVSWEVCNKVGGIYTVLSSKAEQAMQHYTNYCLIGPYIAHNARIEFTQQQAPELFSKVFDALAREGIKCHYGVWEEVKGKPRVILIDFSGMADKKNNIKSDYWNDYAIDSLRGYWDFEEPALWSYCAGRLISMLNSALNGAHVVAQFHEWLAAFGLLYLKKHSKVATVFTTHATVLGRALSGNGVDLYHSLNTIDPIAEAYKNNIEAKHLTEKAAALNATVFTTVSEITAMEAEKFLGRRPEVLLYNGLDIEKFPSFEDISIKHRISRDKIREFLTYYFFPYYTFDIARNLIFYTIGRCEYHNKGYDILVKALGLLNQRLREQGTAPVANHSVSVFFWIPMEHQGVNINVLENKNYYMHIKDYVNINGPEILTRLTYDLISRKAHPEQGLLNDAFISNLKKDMIAFERQGNPPLSTHVMDESKNALLSALKDNGLLNRPTDPVKVIVEPVYIDGSDGFIDLTYYDAIIGCHLGLFPSYYEPWGYTPMESMALGVPALTTDLSGFGMFIKNHSLETDGVYVLERFNKPEDALVKEFANMLYTFMQYTQEHRIDCKLNAKALASKADWKLFIEHYITAHNMALKKVYG
jgi:glycogen(starch) synthase